MNLSQRATGGKKGVAARDFFVVDDADAMDSLPDLAGARYLRSTKSLDPRFHGDDGMDEDDDSVVA